MVLNLRRLWTHARSNPYTWLTGLLLCISSYLCLVNLDYSLLWDDEAYTAITGNNFLKTGTLTQWDGRNLDSTTNGISLNSNAESIWPPLKYLISAAGVWLFGFNETGARVVHAFIGVLALVMFLLLLKLKLPENQRLVFFIFLFVSLSPQLLLFLRAGHYFSFAVFSFIACCYFYEQYWRSRRYLWLASFSIMGLLSFLNHYSCGAASLLTILLVHVILRSSATSTRQWFVFSTAGLCIVSLGGWYLFSSGGASSVNEVLAIYGRGAGNNFSVLDHLLKLLTGVKTVVACDWLAWLSCVWLFIHWWHYRKVNEISHGDFFESRKLIFIGLLLTILSVLLSVQGQHIHTVIELRYSVIALPYLLVVKGVFIDWCVGKNKIIASTALFALLFSSAGAFPFNLINYHTGQPTHGFWLISFIKEIHRPYRPDPIDAVASYLRRQANYDDLVFVNIDRLQRPLMFYVGDHVLFCCQVDPNNHRLVSIAKKMRMSLLYNDVTIPDYIVFFRPDYDIKWRTIAQNSYNDNWIRVHLPVFHDQTHRPHAYYHLFKPHPEPIDGGIIVLKRKDNPAHPDRWF